MTIRTNFELASYNKYLCGRFQFFILFRGSFDNGIQVKRSSQLLFGNKRGVESSIHRCAPYTVRVAISSFMILK